MHQSNSKKKHFAELPDFVKDVQLPTESLLYSISPLYLPPVEDIEQEVRRALSEPIGCEALDRLINSDSKILIIADDLTRPTPHKLVLPPLLDYLEECGARCDHIEILIALGTHRPMTAEEIEGHFGREVVSKVKVSNHEFKDPSMVLEYGRTSDGTPITVNRRLAESDFAIGLSSIVPHAQVGWGGGCKIVLPGISGEQTVEAMHMMAARMPDYPRFAGQVENPVRDLIEEVATKAGLRFIMNVIFNSRYEVVQLVAGDPVKAHRAGVAVARDVFIRKIPAAADVVICNAHPADLEYWQGLKPVTLAGLGLKEGGIIILYGAFPDGISQSHKEVEMYGALDKEELDQLAASGTLSNGLFLGALYQHVLVRDRAEVYCVSPGLSSEQKKALGFSHYVTIQEALEAALAKLGPQAKIGIIDQGGEVVPQL